jgi:sensor c-di-GMP phosphodiesterase-like protein
LARNLHLNVIAEGVETEAQLEFLRAEGCHQWLGFLFSKAVPADQFEMLMQQHQSARALTLEKHATHGVR